MASICLSCAGSAAARLTAAVILVQMFIAVINEGWALAEEQKHREQLRKFVGRTDPQQVEQRWLAWWNPCVVIEAQG